MRRILIGVTVFLGVLGVVYLSTLGCCALIGSRASCQKTVSLIDQLQLTPAQRKAVLPLQKSYLAQKESSCQTLCAKRAQLIQLLKNGEPDRSVMNLLVEEIGQEQAALEKATLEHLLAMKQSLTPSQQEKLTHLMTQQLRTACQATACGATPGCALKQRVSRE